MSILCLPPLPNHHFSRISIAHVCGEFACTLDQRYSGTRSLRLLLHSLDISQTVEIFWFVHYPCFWSIRCFFSRDFWRCCLCPHRFATVLVLPPLPSYQYLLLKSCAFRFQSIFFPHYPFPKVLCGKAVCSVLPHVVAHRRMCAPEKAALYPYDPQHHTVCHPFSLDR